MESEEESYSGDSSSSGSSSNSSDGEQERLESVRVLGTSFQLPQDLCENPNIFKEFLSTNTWNRLDNEQRQHLKLFLPTFPENDEDEKEETVRRLFARENFHFGSPLDTFFEDLREGNFRPDLAKMKKVLLKARDKQQKHKLRSIYARTMADILVSRERLLTAAQYGPPGPPPRLLTPPPKSEPTTTRPPYVRTKLRYFQELAAIRSEVGMEEISEDENFPDGPPVQSKRARRHLTAIQNSIGGSETFRVQSTLGSCEESGLHAIPPADWIRNALAAHRAKRLGYEKSPELDTTGVTLSEIKQRVAVLNGHKKPVTANSGASVHQRRTPTRDQQVPSKAKRGRGADRKRRSLPNQKRTHKNSSTTNGKSTTTDNESASDGLEMRNLVPGFISNVRVKSECRSEESEAYEMEDDSEGNSSYLEAENPQTGAKRFRGASVDVKHVKEDIDKKLLRPCSRATPSREHKHSIMDSNSRIKADKLEELKSVSSNILPSQPVPLKLEDLDGIDMMDLPVELEGAEPIRPEEDINLRDVSESASGLVEATHSSFFALVRELFPAPGHRAVPRALRDRLNAWKASPISPLNHWYHLVDDWTGGGVLMSALDFLSGESKNVPDDFVPYLQYKPQHDVYQWIGAGRDCDATLTSLFHYWLDHRRLPSTALPPAAPAPLQPPTQPSMRDSQPDRIPTPPPRWATSWTVRPASNAELADFRAQERRRFAAPHRAFTYMQHAYRSVVGPLAGAGVGAGGVRGGALGGGNSVLAASRPRHVTMLALVRDAVARLPNGEGTRADIAMLLRMSQWVVCNRESGLAGAVSGALDRLHANTPNPSVRYSPARKLWIYMHRNRSEEELEALYMENVASKKSAAKARCKKPSTATTTVSKVESETLPETNMELEVGSEEEIASLPAVTESDSDVDVDDSGPAPSLPPAPTLVLPPTPTSLLTSTSTLITPTLTPSTKPKLTPTPILTLSTPVTPQSAPTANAPAPSPAAPAPPPTTPACTVSMPTPASAPVVVQHQSTPVSMQSAQAAGQIQVSIPQQSPQGVKVQTTARSLLLRPTAALPPTSLQTSMLNVGVCAARRAGVVRVLSPAAPQPGKSLISPRALLPTVQQTQPATRSTVSVPRRRIPVVSSSPSLANTGSVSTATSIPFSQVRATSAIRNATLQSVKLGNQTVQLPGGQSVQLSTSQAVQLSSGQAVRLSSGRAVHLSSGQTVQLSSGQTVQLATSQAPPLTSTQSIQLTGNQISGNQVVQLSNQGHTVQLSSGTQTVQLSSGQTLQLSNSPSVQTVQLPSGQTVQLAGQSGQTVQLASGQTVQIASAQPTQTVQLPGGQTVQLQSGQTVQLPNGQTVQLASGQAGQTVQLASGQTVQLSTGQTVQMAPRGGLLAVRPQRTIGDKPTQPLVAKLLTNAQGQVISVEGMLGSRSGGRTVAVGAPVLQLQRRPAPLQHHTSLQMRGGGLVRVVSPSSVGLTRLGGRPVLLTSTSASASATKPLQNIILQGDGTNTRVSAPVSVGIGAKHQTLVLSSIAGTSQGTRPQTPTLKLQQVTPRGTLQHIKMSPGVKIQQTGAGGTTQVLQLSSGQQLKVVGAAGSRHVLARVVRPAPSPVPSGAPPTTQTQ